MLHKPPKCNMNSCIYLTTLPWAGCDTRSVFKRPSTGLNSVFYFLTSCYMKVKFFVYNWRRENIWIYTFLKSKLCEMQIASSRIWTQVVKSIPAVIIVMPQVPLRQHKTLIKPGFKKSKVLPLMRKLDSQCRCSWKEAVEMVWSDLERMDSI